MRFAHIADTHIRNLKYHHEYNEVFKQLYESLRNENVDYIIHCGDIAHTKTQISPEFVEMCSKFLTNLATIAPTYVILGNHDGNLKNASRQDALTPIVEALNNPNLHLLKESQEVVLDDSFALNVLSVFDENNWNSPSDENLVNIALYHGLIDRAKTDLNWTLEGDHDISIFDKFDFAFLGDIHKTQILDLKGTIRYPGSTVQQNFGECLDKGYLLWDIKDKQDFTCKLITFKNPKPFVTITLNPDATLPKGLDVTEGARVRVVSESNIPLHKMRRAIDLVKHKFKPETVTYMNKSDVKSGSVDASNVSSKEDLRDISIQQKLIREYLKDYEISEEVMNNILAMNTRFNASIEENEDVYRNVNWSVKSLEWDNFFNYGENNKINFDKLNGIVGIFGKNFSGKSSIVDSMLYTIYENVSKPIRKNLNIVNQNKDYGFGKIVIEVGDKTYNIERKTEKYIKKLKGVETLEAKTSTDFFVTDAIGNVTELNGVAKGETNGNIRKHFGLLDDFLMTSMASQLDSLTFIGKKTTDRKKILAKFLDLEIFEKKHELAKAESKDKQALLKKLEAVNYDELIDENTLLLEESNNRLEENQEKCVALSESLEVSKKLLTELQSKIDSAPTEIINPRKLKTQIETTQNSILDCETENKSLSAQLTTDREYLLKIEDFMKGFEIKTYEQKLESVSAKRKELDTLILELESNSNERTRLLNKSDLLKEVPCGSQFPTCKFIQDAHKSLELIQIVESKNGDVALRINAIGEELGELEPDKVESYIERYNQVLQKKTDTESGISKTELQLEKLSGQAYRLKSELSSLEDKLAIYEKNKEVIENLEGVVEKRDATKKLITDTKKEIEQCRSNTNMLFRDVGSIEQQIKSLQENKQEMLTLRSEFAAYKLYMDCCHPDGISYDIIKNRLPLINEEIAKILTGIVDFEVFILNEGKSLDIFIKHPKYEPRPLEMGSGAEKTISSMAIRLALLSVTNLPKPDLFIMDEPGTALDEDNMEGFVRIIDMVKSHFKTVILISHLDALKDSVDTQIAIDKSGGYAHVNI